MDLKISLKDKNPNAHTKEEVDKFVEYASTVDDKLVIMDLFDSGVRIAG